MRDGARAALLTGAIAAAAIALERTVLPTGLAAVTVGLLLGLVLGNLGAVGDAARPALTTISSRLLPLAIVLIGLRTSFDTVGSVGGSAAALAGAALVVGAAAAALGARLVGVGGRLAALIAIGTAICGNTAIVAAAPILRARRAEVAYAAATVTLFGTIGVLALPALGHLLGLSDRAFGLWAGAGVHDTSQVVAAGFAYSDEAGVTATVVKLVRNLALVPLLLLLPLLAGGAGARPGRALRLPWFVLGFLAASALVSAVELPETLLEAANETSHALVIAAITAIGLGTRLQELVGVGPRPLAVGLVAMTGSAGVALVLALLLGG